MRSTNCTDDGVPDDATMIAHRASVTKDLGPRKDMLKQMAQVQHEIIQQLESILEVQAATKSGVDRLEKCLLQDSVSSSGHPHALTELFPVVPATSRTTLMEIDRDFDEGIPEEVQADCVDELPTNSETLNLSTRVGDCELKDGREDPHSPFHHKKREASESGESQTSQEGRKMRRLHSEGIITVEQRVFDHDGRATLASQDTGVDERISAQLAAFRFSNSFLNNASVDRIFSQVRRSRQAVHRILQRSMMRPTSFRLAVLDVLSFLALCSDMTVIPYILAWDTEASFYSVVLMTTVFWWTLNIFFNFFTGFYSQGELEMRPKAVALHYLRGHFLVDSIIALCDWAGFVATLVLDGSTYFRALTKFPRFLKLLRLLRMSSFLRMTQLSSRLQNHIQGLTFGYGSAFSETADFILSTVTLMAAIIWANHLMGCAFYAIGTHASSDTGTRWLDAKVDPQTTMTYWEAPARLQYLACLQWSFSQMSPGSPLLKPVNSSEVLFNLGCLTCGVVVFGSVVSTITATMMQWRRTRSERRKVLDELNNFMAQRRISPNVAIQAREQVQVKMMKHKRIFLQDVSALSLLSHKVHVQVHEETCRIHLLGHPLFRTVWRMHDRTLKKICIKSVSFQVLLPHDELFQENHPGEAAYHVVSGLLNYADQDAIGRMSTVNNRTQKNLLIGDQRWLCWSCLWCHWIHCGSCKALESAEVLRLDAECLVQAVRFHGPTRAFLHEYATAYLKQVLNAVIFDDVEVPFTEHREIVWSMDHQHKKAISKLALDTLLSNQWRFRLHSKAWAILQSEIVLGSSILLETCEGEVEIVERVVAVTALRVSRNDGHILVCLLKFTKDEGLVPFPQFLGTKQQVIDDRLEDPQAAAERLLEQTLGQLRCASPFRLSCPRRDDIVERSTRFRLRTHYLRSVFELHVNPIEKMPGLQVVGGQRVQDECIWHCIHSTLPGLAECFVLDGPGFMQVCAWVPNDDYLASLRTQTGHQMLARYADLLTSAIDPRTGKKLFEMQRSRFSKFSEASHVAGDKALGQQLPPSERQIGHTGSM